MENKKYVIGADIGGTTVKLGLFEEDGTLLEKWEIPTVIEGDGTAVLRDIAAEIQKCREKHNIPADGILGVGAGIPGPVTADGVVHRCVNLGWGVFDVRTALEETVGLPVVVVNDANAAAMGETWKGGGRGSENVVFITLGTGVGGGIIIGGKIYAGMRGAGAELGHTVLVLDGEPCTCGRRGCWEAYASATALIRQTREAAVQNPQSLLAQVPAEQINGRTVFDAADRGDAAAQRVIDRYCEYIAAGMTDIVNALAPEMILLGGGVSRQGERLLAPIREYIATHCFGQREGAIPVVAAAQLGNDAGIIGAAAL